MRFDTQQKALVVLNKLNQTYKDFTMRDFIEFMEKEQLKEGITQVLTLNDKMVVIYK
jgi:hypothetical protein